VLHEAELLGASQAQGPSSRAATIPDSRLDDTFGLSASKRRKLISGHGADAGSSLASPSSSCVTNSNKGNVGARWVELRPLSIAESWQAWLHCQGHRSPQRAKWPDPSSWAFWHTRHRSLNQSDEWSPEDWARYDCAAIDCYEELSPEKIIVCPMGVLFTQDSISSSFGSGEFNGQHIDTTIKQLLTEEIRVDDLPEIDVFFLDGRLHSLNNRRLFVFRVLECIRIRDGGLRNFCSRHGQIALS
jgi:hypothetical protein